MDSNYELLISKINEFTRKFYLNKLLRGLIYTLAVLTALYLLLFVLMYYLQPGIYIKTSLFYSYILVFLFFAGIGVIKPGLAYFKMTRTLSTQESAAMIGDHFQEVRDKLLNTLQLKELADLSPQQNMLILAGIDQKINELKPVPFSNAIRLNENKKYIKYFLIPLLVIMAIGLLAPAILRDGTRSFVQYNKEILPEAPFRFNLLNAGLTVLQGDDLRLELKLTGDELPQEVYIQEGVNTFRFEKDNTSNFHYTFNNLQRSKVLRFRGGGFSSAIYQITVKPHPGILGMTATLSYPAYLKKTRDIIQNNGDLTIPEGTIVQWDIKTEHSDQLSFLLGTAVNRLKVENNRSDFKAKILNNTTYQIAPLNKFSGATDPLIHKIDVIADLAPGINITEARDSLSRKALYFTGNISDDHGFSSLKFIYTIKDEGLSKKTVVTSLPLKTAQTEASFFHFWNLKNVGLKPGEVLEYFFEVADNDGVNGYKRTRSATKTFVVPSPRQIAEQLNEGSNVLKQKMNGAIKLAAEIEKESKKLGQDLLDKKGLSFEDKKEVSRLLEKQQKLENTVEEIKKIKEKNSTEARENDAVKSELADKQKQIDELFNNVLDPKTKSLLEKLQSLMDQNNKDQTHSELSKLNMDNKSLKNELDRILELYKQLEFEQELQNKIDRLNTLASAQKELSNKTKTAKKADAGNLKKQQEALSSDFDAIKKELEQLGQKNESLERPNSFKNPEKETQQIQNEQQESIKQLEKNQQDKAAASQQTVSEKLKALSQQLEEEQQQSAEMESNLNTAELRTLLQNLLYSSFEQEKIMLNLRKIPANDPSYSRNVQEQRSIKDNVRTLSDSLAALSKRVPQIESTVNEEMQKINFNVDKSLENLSERRTSEALKNQQYTMTSINNLSLMLNEALDQLQKNQKNAKNGGKGSKKQSLQQLQQMQQQLNKNMQQAKDQLQKEGNKGRVPTGNRSEEFAKMAQQQQMIREALQRINSEENKDGKGSLGNLNEMIKDMKLTETDLVNKRIEEETLNRQKNLLTKLLESEKADRERDEDEKRESKAGQTFPPSYLKMLKQFKKKQAGELELQQKLPADLNHYYKNKISDYFKLLNLR